jgi:predicted secreted hydrolase
VQDSASNTGILTLAQLTSAQAAGDVSGFVDTHIYFNSSAVSGAVYMGGTPLSFPPLG